MSASEEMMQQMIRAGHIEQAKGHLRAALHTYYGKADDFESVSSRIEKFIEWLESEAPGIA